MYPAGAVNVIDPPVQKLVGPLAVITGTGGAALKFTGTMFEFTDAHPGIEPLTE